MGDYIINRTKENPPIVLVDDSNLVDSLISWEGFIEHPRDIGDGKITLGSGLTDPKWIKLYHQRGNVWSKEDNRNAVASEVADRRKWASENIPNWNLLDPESQKALLSYKYNYDFNSTNSPKMYEALANRNWKEAARQMDATSDDPKFKKGLEERRRREQNWFMSGVQNTKTTEKTPENESYFGRIKDSVLKAFEETIKAGSKTGSWAYGGNLNDPWNNLSTQEKAMMMRVANKHGILNLSDIMKAYNEYAEGGPEYSVGNLVDAIYSSNPKEEFLGKPSHHYDFAQSEEWANAHGYYSDARGHRDDRVKKPAHPSHPSKGIWQGDTYILTDKGMEDPNYTMFGLVDDGQDPQATLVYKNGIVLPEYTVTPSGNYIYNSYDNIKVYPQAFGGPLVRDVNMFDLGGDDEDSFPAKASRFVMSMIHGTGNHNLDSGEPSESAAQATYLLDRDNQKKQFLKYGYTEAPGDYGLVKKAVGKRNIPVFQRKPDDANRENLIPIGNVSDVWYGDENAKLVHPGSYPTAVYMDPKTLDLYQKAWDLNDYGPGPNSGAANTYNIFQEVASSMLDTIGNPVVVTSGISKVQSPAALKEMKDAYMLSKGLYPGIVTEKQTIYSPFGGSTEVNVPKDIYTLPEVIVTAPKKRSLGGPLVDVAMKHIYDGTTEPTQQMNGDDYTYFGKKRNHWNFHAS